VAPAPLARVVHPSQPAPDYDSASDADDHDSDSEDPVLPIKGTDNYN
jgi:hypothetical protein